MPKTASLEKERHDLLSREGLRFKIHYSGEEFSKDSYAIALRIEIDDGDDTILVWLNEKELHNLTTVLTNPPMPKKLEESVDEHNNL